VLDTLTDAWLIVAASGSTERRRALDVSAEIAAFQDVVRLAIRQCLKPVAIVGCASTVRASCRQTH